MLMHEALEIPADGSERLSLSHGSQDAPLYSSISNTALIKQSNQIALQTFKPANTLLICSEQLWFSCKRGVLQDYTTH